MFPCILRPKRILFIFIPTIVSFSFVACKNKATGGKGVQEQGDSITISGMSAKTNQSTVGYKTFQSFTPKMLSGRQVKVYMIEDKRLAGTTAEAHYYPTCHTAQLRFNSDANLMNPDHPDYKPAIFLMIGNAGDTISYKILDAPCARIDAAYLNENKTSLIYLFTLDYSTGMGSYSGPATYFVNFADTGMVCYNADNALATTLKSIWVMHYSNNNLEVWSKTCRPGFDTTKKTDLDDDFKITKTKSVWLGNGFKATTKIEKGFWEDEGDTSTESVKQFLKDFSK